MRGLCQGNGGATYARSGSSKLSFPFSHLLVFILVILDIKINVPPVR